MKQKNSSQKPNPKRTSATRSAAAADFRPWPGDVARKAYFSDVNEGSEPGHKPKQLITHHFTLDDIMNAYETFGNVGRERALKVVLTSKW